MSYFFYTVHVTVFPDNVSTKHIWMGKIPILASSVIEARTRAIAFAKDAPEVKFKTQHYASPDYRVYEISRGRQVFKKRTGAETETEKVEIESIVL